MWWTTSQGRSRIRQRTWFQRQSKRWEAHLDDQSTMNYCHHVPHTDLTSHERNSVTLETRNKLRLKIRPTKNTEQHRGLSLKFAALRNFSDRIEKHRNSNNLDLLRLREQTHYIADISKDRTLLRKRWSWTKRTHEKGNHKLDNNCSSLDFLVY